MDKNGRTKFIEMETFIQKETGYVQNDKYMIVKNNSDEILSLNKYHPFKARELEHPVSSAATFMHLLKSCLGTGILAMPFAFKCSGLIVGVVGMVLASVICTHCAYILVTSAHHLYRKTGKTTLTFADVAEEACLGGPRRVQPYANLARCFVNVSIFVTYFGTCSAYTVIIAKSLDKVTTYYYGTIDVRLYLSIIAFPLVLVVFVPNLRYLALVSMGSNVLMAAAIVLTCYYLVNDLPSLEEREMAADISKFPTFFSISIFGLEAIGIVMPLENNMRKPQKFVGICGVLNLGMAIVTLVYILVGFLGYYRFGDQTLANVTLNLPANEYAAQAVQILISLAIFGTFGLPFFVFHGIVWHSVKDRFPNRPTLADYILRTVLFVVMLLLAIAVPTIGPFIELIGALCFSILGILLPIVIEIITFWESGFGVYNWRIFKNVVVILLGIIALVWGSRAALQEIMQMYSSEENIGSKNFVIEYVTTTNQVPITQLL